MAAVNHRMPAIVLRCLPDRGNNASLMLALRHYNQPKRLDYDILAEILITFDFGRECAPWLNHLLTF